MASERNRIIELTEYLSSLGIQINIGKNKAQGHKGFFRHGINGFRIDISKDIDEKDKLSAILHEFAHFIHYSYDTSLRSLNFIFGEFSDEIREELIKITVHDVPKDFASNLYSKKEQINLEIKTLISRIKALKPNFKMSDLKDSYHRFSGPLQYLLKYDRIKYFNKIYTVETIDKDFALSEENKLLIKIKSKQRAVKRINSRISRLNRYYNNPTELFARFLDYYFTKPEYTRSAAPTACKMLESADINYIKKIENIFS